MVSLSQSRNKPERVRAAYVGKSPSLDTRSARDRVRRGLHRSAWESERPGFRSRDEYAFFYRRARIGDEL